MRLTAFFLTAACGGPTPPPEWIDLSVGFEPSVRTEPAEWRSADGGPSPVVPDESGDGMWLEQELDAASWEQDELGRWSRPRPESFIARTRMTARLELVGPEGPIDRKLTLDGRTDPESDEVFVWISPEDRLVLQDVRLEGPPAGLVLREYVERGTEVDGRRRAVVGEVTAFGLDVWPGEEAVREVSLAGDAMLRFVTAAAGSRPGARATFTIRDGERELFRFEQAVRRERSGERSGIPHAVPLAAPSEGALRLTFAVEGDADITAFLVPVVGPREVGTFGARPWGDDRTSVVLISADTLRADGLAAWGGPPDRMPRMNALAEESVRFVNARSPSSWTLPAHVSMCTGLFPGQHGITRYDLPLPDQAVTLAEQFARSGYRTVAVTDSIFLSTTYGLDQGFAWFEEHEDWYSNELLPVPPLERTLDAALDALDRDDGRPVLLFVHTYRTHAPYRPDAAEDPAEHEVLRKLRVERFRARDPDLEVRVALGDFVERYRDLYWEGVTALDAALGPFWDELARRGLDDAGAFCFTSDHGEAFYEHGKGGHSLLPHEEQVRVPLILRAPGLEPATDDRAVSLIDLPRTLADLAGVPAAPEWSGRSLLEPGPDEPVFALHDKTWALVHGDRKVFFRLDETAEVTEAYDLATDPNEQDDLAGRADWPEELLEAWSAEIERLRTRGLTSREQELSPELREQLDVLGYTGE